MLKKELLKIGVAIVNQVFILNACDIIEKNCFRNNKRGESIWLTKKIKK